MASYSVQAKKEKKRRKSPVLATVESTAVLFFVAPFSGTGRSQSQGAVGFGFYRPFGVWAEPPGLYPATVSPVD